MQLHGWNLIFLAAFIAYVIIRGVFERQTRSNEKLIRQVDACERALLVAVGVGSLGLPLLYLFTPWLGFADYRLPAAAPWCGTAILAMALRLFWRSHSDLGRNWSITLELRKGHELVTHGVYSSLRHPMYASIWLWDIGQGLLLQNWLAGWTALATFAVMYFVRTPREERMMIAFFGDHYREHMRKTGRIFPRLRKS
jgi:protein-S-isoprenylcysteine O-methyltransferase Ste14